MMARAGRRAEPIEHSEGPAPRNKVDGGFPVAQASRPARALGRDGPERAE
jgi:hypothetical protein